MGIYISGMDMPNGCRHCELLINCDACEGYKCFCSAMGSDIGYFEDLSKTQRHKDCPLIEVQIPHGRTVEEKILRDIAVEWLRNLLNDIGQSKHQDLWHYGQALSEIIDSLQTQAAIESEE